MNGARHVVLAIVAVLAAAAACQWMLGGLKFSSSRAEWVFRTLFLVPGAFSVYAVQRAGGRPPWRAWAGALPAVAVVLLYVLGRGGADAQGALFIVMLPFVHWIGAVLHFLLTGPRAGRD